MSDCVQLYTGRLRSNIDRAGGVAASADYHSHLNEQSPCPIFALQLPKTRFGRGDYVRVELLAPGWGASRRREAAALEERRVRRGNQLRWSLRKSVRSLEDVEGQSEGRPFGVPRLGAVWTVGGANPSSIDSR